LQREPAVDHDDLEIRREALISDLEKLAAGWTPDAAMLASCPLLDQWSVVHYPGTTDLAMQGWVTNHPRLREGWCTTSPIRAMDLPGRWIRTHGRFYRLGKRDFDA
jgi:hypothetical protein